MIDGPKRQRHGVSKNLIEGIGGLLVGAAAVLLLRAWLSPRTATAPSMAPEARPQAMPTPPAPAKTRRHPSPKTKPEPTP